MLSNDRVRRLGELMDMGYTVEEAVTDMAQGMDEDDRDTLWDEVDDWMTHGPPEPDPDFDWDL